MSEVTRGKKQCPQCGVIVGVRTAKCECGYEFTTKRKLADNNPPIDAIEYFVKYARDRVDSMSEEEVLSAVTLQYIEVGMAYCGVHNFLDRSESFEVDNYLEDDIPGDLIGDYIWLEEEVEAERAYQKEEAL